MTEKQAAAKEKPRKKAPGQKPGRKAEPFRKTIAVDLDGVLAEYNGWEGIRRIGAPINGAKQFVEKLAALGDVLIFTTRCNPAVNKGTSIEDLRKIVAAWLKRHEIPYHDIYVGFGKPIASAYIDDRALVCRPQEWYSNAPFAFDETLRGVERLLREGDPAKAPVEEPQEHQDGNDGTPRGE